MSDLKLQLSSTKLQCAMDLMPELRLLVHSIGMPFVCEIMAKEEPEIRQIVAKGEKREEKGISTFISHVIEERGKILSCLSC